MSTPSPTELAMIAATLAHGREIDYRKLAGDAYWLWEACRDQIADLTAMRKARLGQEKPPFEKPEEWPITFDEALRLWLPGLSETDRFKQFRDYVIDECLLTNKRLKPADAIAKLKAEQFYDDRFGMVGDRFLAWKAKQISEKRSASAKKRKNPLTR